MGNCWWTYEVFLVYSKFVRDKNKNHKHSLKLQNINHKKKLADLKIKHDAEIAKLEETIAYKNREIKSLELKNNNEQKKLNKEIIDLRKEKGQAAFERNNIEKINRFYVRKLHQLYYSPVKKNLDIKYLNNFNEVLKYPCAMMTIETENKLKCPISTQR